MVFIRDTRAVARGGRRTSSTRFPGYDDDDTLQTSADLDRYLAVNPYTGTIRRDEAELAAVRAIRPRLRRLWEVDREGAVPLVNEMLARRRARSPGS